MSVDRSQVANQLADGFAETDRFLKQHNDMHERAQAQVTKPTYVFRMSESDPTVSMTTLDDGGLVTVLPAMPGRSKGLSVYQLDDYQLDVPHDGSYPCADIKGQPVSVSGPLVDQVIEVTAAAGIVVPVKPPRMADSFESVDRFPKEKPPVDPIMQFFAYDHLPEHLQVVSKPFGMLAQTIVEGLPRNPERTVALRYLLNSKDAAVRAMLFK